MNAIDQLRQNFSKYLVVLLWVNIPLFFVVGEVLDVSHNAMTLVAAGLSLLNTVLYFVLRGGFLFRMITALNMTAMPALLVYMLSGHPWQLDAHMYFFAMLAMTAAMLDWKAVLLSTTAIALHHLLLNFLMPYAVFPEGADFGRVIFHAVIVVLEAVVLVWLTHTIVKREKDHASEINNLAGDMERSLQASIQELNTLSSDIETAFMEIFDVIKTTNQSASVVSSTAEQNNMNLQNVSSASEELTQSIQDIGQRAAISEKSVKSAVSEAQDSNEKMQDLKHRAEGISKITEMINDIAEQTNLLALNATIEAARAGEAGKGFAVVANEVKSLASQTGEATENITQEIEAMQNLAEETAARIEQFFKVIQDVSESSSNIAAAVEQQNAATRDITHNIHGIAGGTNLVTTSMNELSQKVSTMDEVASLVMQKVQAQKQQADVLEKNTGAFLEKIRG